MNAFTVSLQQQCETFEICLDAVRTLEGAEERGDKDRAYLGLVPDPASVKSLTRLRKAALATYPECRQGDSAEWQDFHVTVGQFPRAEAEEHAQAWGKRVRSSSCLRHGSVKP